MGYFYPSLRDLQGLPHLLPLGDLIDEGLLSLFEQPEQERYEVIGPPMLFGDSMTERAEETDVSS